MRYVDGYVLPIPNKHLAAYRRMAQKAGKGGSTGPWTTRNASVRTWKKTQVWVSRFRKVIKLKPGETIVFAFIVFKSRAHRDRVNAKGHEGSST